MSLEKRLETYVHSKSGAAHRRCRSQEVSNIYENTERNTHAHTHTYTHNHIYLSIHINFYIRVLSMPRPMSNAGSPCISDLWVNGSLAMIIDTNLHTFRSWLLDLPRHLVPGIGRSVTDLIQDVVRCACRHQPAQGHLPTSWGHHGLHWRPGTLSSSCFTHTHAHIYIYILTLPEKLWNIWKAQCKHPYLTFPANHNVKYILVCLPNIPSLFW